VIQTQTKTIDGHTYDVSQFGARTGLQVAVRVFKVVGPAVASLAVLKDLREGKGPKMTETQVEDLLATVLKTVSETAKEEDFLWLADQFASVTKLHGTPDKAGNVAKVDLAPMFDHHFRGRYMAMFQWFVFAGQVNFASFFDGSGTGAANSAGPNAPAVAGGSSP
jgi:hypothetical protein